MRNLTVLGSTGSIGTQTLDVVRKNGQEDACERDLESGTHLQGF